MKTRIPLLVVCGATASGKTQLSIDLAKRFDGEICGADSMQIYKGMAVGTAKPDINEMQGIPHHLIDFQEPDRLFSVAEYVSLAKKTIEGIHARGRLPVLTGGTGLYISSLVDNISFGGIASDSSLREELKAVYGEKGAAYMHEQLRLCDPELAEKLHPNNIGRIIRAIEVFRVTGEKMSELQKKSRQTPSEYDLCMLGICYRDREKLYERINLRVDNMLENGLVREAKAVYDAGMQGTAGQAIGYKELAGYFDGNESLDEAVQNIKQATRRYAKRQMTWLRRDERIRWLEADVFESYAAMLDKAVDIVRESLGRA